MATLRITLRLKAANPLMRFHGNGIGLQEP